MECIICGDGENSGRLVNVTKGLKTICEASQSRKDDLHIKLRNMNSASVHEECRKLYTRPGSIAAVLRIGDSPCSSKDLLPSRELRSSISSFDFKIHCVLCGNDVMSVDPKHPHKLEQSMSEVATLEVRETLIRAAIVRDDEWGEVVRARLDAVIDLVAAEGRYHRLCFAKFLTNTTKPERGVGRPENPIAREAFGKLCDYINVSDECQYSLKELVNVMNNYLPDPDHCYTEKHLKNKLIAHYKSGIVITELPGKVNILSRRETSHRILTDAWYSDRQSDISEERMRIVRTAAAIIREDIRSSIYDCSTYPILTDIDSLAGEQVPETLRFFTDNVTQVRDKAHQGMIRKRSAINHAIIAACRPRSFLSSIQIGTSVYLHRKYGSKHLIDILAAMGFCSSYEEARRYLENVMDAAPPEVDYKAFVQFVFDNADVNVRTLNGLGTFHATGGIKCVTPAAGVKTNLTVIRRKAKASNPSTYPNSIPVVPYRHPMSKPLQEITFADLSVLYDRRKCTESLQRANRLDALWVSTCLAQSDVEKRPGWSGFMTAISNSSETFQTTRILAVPFINLEASNVTSIYSALTFACTQSSLHNQPCIVTFDQPLYMKARSIVASQPEGSELKSAIVRLGGFHLLMSYLGAIGNIMEGSGLEDLWKVAYGQSTVAHMMTGHAYARAVRAHLLTYQALVTVLARHTPSLSEFCGEELQHLYDDVLHQENSPLEASQSPPLIRFANALDIAAREMSATGRTPALWMQYLEQVALMLRFIRAEREGNWVLHLDSVVSMLPYFHAAGHILYAKSAHLYAQDMCTLASRLPPDVYESFTTKGFFTIRRSERFWSGIWSDMCIEQMLMRSLKTTGGLTRGRGITEHTLNSWVETAPASVVINDALEMFFGVNSQSTEQHVEMRPSRQSRDAKDRNTFVDWLQMHSPFEYPTQELVNISSGRISEDTINCDKAHEIGTQLMKGVIGQNMSTVKMRRKDKVKSQAAVLKGIKFREDIIVVNPEQLFHRITCLSKGADDLRRYFTYELASVPPALFDDISIRKGTKSSLVPILYPQTKHEECIPIDSDFVLDGGKLLHSVVWCRPTTYSELYQRYTSHVEHLYSRSCAVVFDGYPQTPTTKGEEQRRRSSRENSCEILFEDGMTVSTSQTQFLSNSRNKERFIHRLTNYLTARGISVIKSNDDADTDIVGEALKRCQGGRPVTIIGDDTDLLVILAATATASDNIFILKTGTGTRPSKVIACQTMLKHLGGVRRFVPFVHAMTGCDTTSALYRKGKRQAMELIQKSADVHDDAETFCQADSSKEAIAISGERFLLRLYGATEENSLNDLRYSLYVKATAKLSLTSKFVLASLPPTTAAAKEHSLRVYLQVQRWLGIQHEATDFGWKLHKGNLVAVTTSETAVPEELLNLISCNCKSACRNACGCRRLGLLCTNLCGQCQGISCTNVSITQLTANTDSESEEENTQDMIITSDDEVVDEFVDDDSDVTREENEASCMSMNVLKSHKRRYSDME